MSYILTLTLDDDALAEILSNEYKRTLTAQAVKSEAVGIVRDFGAVLEFRHEGFQHEAASLREQWPPAVLTVDLLDSR